MVAQSLVGLAVLICFNRFTIVVGLASLVVVAVYPLMKRVTSWPQAVLGLAFSWGALVGWTATFGAARLAGARALRRRVVLDRRLRHDLRPAGRARRRHRRHPLDRAAVRRAGAARGRRLFYAATAALTQIAILGVGRRRLGRSSAGSPSPRISAGRWRTSTARARRRRSSCSAPTATRRCCCSRGWRCRAGWA